jgi:hypothetical protein
MREVIFVSFAAALFASVQASAQQISGTPGSPGATITIDGRQLPPPPPKFGADWLGKSLAPGKHTIVFDFKYNGPGFGKGGTGVLSVDGRELSRQTMEHTIPFLMAIDESFDIGIDTRTSVDDSYKLPFRFTGTINKLTYNVRPEQLTAEDRKVMEKALAAVHN